MQSNRSDGFLIAATAAFAAVLIAIAIFASAAIYVEVSAGGCPLDCRCEEAPR